MTTQLSTSEQQPAPLFTPTPQAARRMLEFFTAQINNPHTERESRKSFSVSLSGHISQHSLGCHSSSAFNNTSGVSE